MDGALLRSAFRSPRPTVAVLLFILALAVIPPFIFLVYSSFHTFNPDGSFGSATLANFIQLFTDPRFFRSLFRSAVYALGASLLAIVIGALQAWLAERTDAPCGSSSMSPRSSRSAFPTSSTSWRGCCSSAKPGR